jgi:NADPH-dependent curcumin reductase CurA
MTRNRQVLLVSRPIGIPQAEHFDVVESSCPSPADGQVLVRVEYLSVEPAMRGWVNAAANYAEPVALGAVMRSLAAGTVVGSRNPRYQVGERLMGWFGWQEYAVSDGFDVLRRVENDGLPLSLSLGVLGLNGLTAWFGVTDVLRPRPGDTVVVSTAAGAVGSTVGQLAALAGCCTVGIAGGPDKSSLCMDEFGYDAAVDYRSPTFVEDLDAACPDGVDGYFDNTSGPITDEVLARLRDHAAVVICGTASVSSWDPPPVGPRVERTLLVRRARMEGLLAFDYLHRLEEAVARLAPLVREGRLRYREDILIGIEQAPDSVAGLYRGENRGKSGSSRCRTPIDLRRRDQRAASSCATHYSSHQSRLKPVITFEREKSDVRF